MAHINYIVYNLKFSFHEELLHGFCFTFIAYILPYIQTLRVNIYIFIATGGFREGPVHLTLL